MMKKRKKNPVWLIALALFVQFALVAGPASPASASTEDVALFYDSLAALGTTYRGTAA